MTAPTTPPPPPEPDGPDRLPWNAAMLEGTVFTPVGRGRNAGYVKDEVDAFKTRAVAQLATLETEYASTYEQLRQHQEAAKQRHDPRRPPVIAVSAVAGGQAQAEAVVANARVYARRLIGDTRQIAERMLADAGDALHAPDTAPAEPDLPSPPQPTGDPAVDLTARHEHLRQVAVALDGWEQQMNAYIDARRAKLAEGRGALAEQTAGFVLELDKLEEVVPTLRAQIEAVDTVEADEHPVAS